MKLGASAASPGVTGRWIRTEPRVIELFLRGGIFAGKVVENLLPVPAWDDEDSRWYATAATVERTGFTHRYQAKRAVEAAVSQALREAAS